MSFLELAAKRYSVRRFRDLPVEEEKLIIVLEAGRIAPSACNYQPWLFYVIQKRENIERVAKAYRGALLKEAPVILVLCGSHTRAWKRDDGKDHCDIDVAIAADHITLAAADIGLGTCWVCDFDKDFCSKVLSLPAHVEPIVMLPLGYPDGEGDPARHTSERKPLSEIVNRDF